VTPLILFAGGLAAGLFSSLLGIGGGFILVPVLFLVKVAPPIAGATSVAFTATVAALASIHYYKTGKISKISAVQVLSGALAGGLLGVITVYFIKDSGLLKKIMESGFILLTFIMAIRMIMDLWYNAKQKNINTHVAIKGIFIGLIVGFISVVLGVGGGFAYVPTFLYLYELPSQIAVGTSLTVIAIANSLASIGNLFINHTLLFSYYLFAVAGAVLGIKISTRIKVSAWLRKTLFLAILLFIFVENIVNLLF